MKCRNIKCLKDIFFHGRHKDNAEILIPLPQASRGIDAIYPRHLDIQKQDLIIFSRGKQLLRRIKNTNLHIMILFLQQFTQPFTDILFIITNCDSHCISLPKFLSSIFCISFDLYYV